MTEKQISDGFAEDISALADGALSPAQAQSTLKKLHADADAVLTWHAYHVVGDVLRSDQLAPTQAEMSFLERFEARLASEVVAAAPAPGHVVKLAREGANDAVFRWKAVAAVSTVAFVLTLSMLGLDRMESGETVAVVKNPSRPVPSEVAAVQAASVETEPVMLRDPALDALLAAHQQMGGTSALQAPSGFLRNATYSGSDR